MTDKSKLLELAERCEAAAGPDRALEMHIYETIGGEGSQHWAAEYTASLDAAMSLVPEGWEDWQVADFLERAIRTWFKTYKVEPTGNADRKRLPLALCAAALRARAFMAEQQQEQETA
jgi:predicted ArsR family transcriptional regulator